MKRFIILFFSFLYSNSLVAKKLNIVAIDESWVCNIKTSCLDCLRLPQCTWCPTENKCFSEQIIKDSSYCQNNKIHHTNYGMSLEENAQCTCFGNEIERNCFPPGEENIECSGRGKCVCGRCACISSPDPENPSKVIIGEYCEYDNFSCDGPKCNEGPYSIHDVDINAETNSDDPIESPGED